MPQWITVWGQAHADIGRICGSKNHTVRLSTICDLNGSQIRLRMSNRDGKKSMQIAEVTMHIDEQPFHRVTFYGEKGLHLLPLEEHYSDPVSLPVVAGCEITISIAFQGGLSSGNQPNELIWHSKKGNYVSQHQIPLAGKSFNERFFGVAPVMPALSSIEVYTEENPDVVVCIGNSITQQGQWTNPLREMLRRENRKIIIINKGIGGNRLLSGAMPMMEMYGRSGVERFQRDVLGEPGVTAVIFELGTNDLAMAKDRTELEEAGADKQITAFIALAEKAKAAGLKTFIATITPRNGTGGWTAERERERAKLNTWIRENSVFDGVLDYDAVTRDPLHPDQFAVSSDSGDHLHPGPLGGQRMARTAYHVLINNL